MVGGLESGARAHALFKATTSVDVQRYAHAAARDGAHAFGCCALSRKGSSGQRPNNVERDLHRHVHRRCGGCSLEPYEIQLPFEKTDDLGVELINAAILLPHEVVGYLHDDDPLEFSRMFGNDASRSEFWEKVSVQEAMRNHPSQKRPGSTLPLSLHGDDVSAKRGQNPISALVISLSSPMSSDCFDGVKLLCCIALKGVPPGTLEMLYAVLLWSFQALATGVYPSCDHRGRKLGGKRAAKADKEIASGMTAYVIDFLADWKFAKEALALPFCYNRFHICHLCTATKDDHSDQRPGVFLGRRRRTLQEFSKAWLGVQHAVPALALLPFFCLLSMLRIDWMHTDHLGVAQWLGGNTLCEVAEARRGPGKYVEAMNRALRKLDLGFKAWTQRQGIDHSQRQFKCSRLGMKSTRDFPCLGSKAHNTAVVCKFLAASSHLVADPLLRNALASWREAQRVVDTAGPILTDQEASDLMAAGEKFCKTWSLLNIQAAAESRARYSVKPKHHHWQHAIHEACATKRNPKSLWLYRHESFVGFMGKLANRTHVATTSTRAVQRYLLSLRRKRALSAPTPRGKPRFARRVRKICK